MGAAAANDHEPQNKRAKTNRDKSEYLTQAPVDGDGRCHFFVAGKGRYCRLLTKAGNKYCGEHMVVSDSGSAKSPTRRVPCPYDPSHSVDMSKLKKHMESLCNSRPPAIRPAFTDLDCNVSLLPPEYAEKSFGECGQLWSEEALAKADARLMVQPGERIYLGTTSSKVFGDLKPSSHEQQACTNPEPLNEATVRRLLRPVVTAYLQSVSAAPENVESAELDDLLELVRLSEDFPVDICTHSALEERSHAKTNPKHALQQSSLIGHLEKRGLLDNRYAFIEFGAGKGELSVYVHAALNPAPEGSDGSSSSSIILVDRKNFRQKYNIVEQDSAAEPLHHRFERIYIDIRDLDLSNIPKLQTIDPATGAIQLRPIVAYSKHLCGAATDLTIKCLERYQLAGGSVAGVAIALCCHQVCKYSMYVDHAHLSTATTHGSGASEWCDIQRDEFQHLTTMSSWAVNAPTPSQPTGDQQQQQQDGQDADPAAHYSGLSFDQRMRAGHAVKRFLDIGRLAFVRQKMGMKNAALVYYTTRSTSPENLALLGTTTKITVP
ncbi:tRNA:m4X modification enzyme [Coemansia aciculifera]|nr:tRNA:m4X modification enzyme [Coemansia aciculifera]